MNNLPGLGISSHTDAACFGDTVCSLTLGSDVIMNLSKDTTMIEVLLKRCSLLILKEQARYEWQHGIVPRKSDRYFGETLVRQRRVSITFRTVKGI